MTYLCSLGYFPRVICVIFLPNILLSFKEKERYNNCHSNTYVVSIVLNQLVQLFRTFFPSTNPVTFCISQDPKMICYGFRKAPE